MQNRRSFNKWLLWLKSTTVTIILLLLMFEVFIVSNEAKKLMNEDAIRVSCNEGAIKLNYGDNHMQFGPSVHDLKRCAKFVVNNPAAMLSPLRFVCLANTIFYK